jgi:hypothetical protein
VRRSGQLTVLDVQGGRAGERRHETLDLDDLTALLVPASMHGNRLRRMFWSG